jgi:threonine/homoserine/homoserine lactone efflux protein
MSPETFTAVLLFSLVMGFTPGPNNVMLAASGARFGIARTLPHLTGVTIGFPVMVLLVGLGLASILLASPKLQLGMKIVSCAYLLWLAFQIARSASASSSTGDGKPMTFLQAAAFQWINPKAWLMAVGAISAYTAGRGMQLYVQVAIIALLTVIVTLLSTLTWTAFGAGIRRWLRAPLALHLFNMLMALLLVGSTVPILLEIWRGLRG